MKLHLEPVTAQNREEILRLGVLPGQKGYIETVAQCMEEAGEYGGWRPVGIYDGDLPVGFSMYGFFREEYPPEGRLWLDRLLIDVRFQGRGYGRAALEALLGYLYLTGRDDRLELLLEAASESAGPGA